MPELPIKKNLIIAYDFGTSSVKAALIDAEGHTVTHAVESYLLNATDHGRVEQSPDDWWQAMCLVTHRLLDSADCNKRAVVAMNICAQMCGVVPVDRNGVALSPCLTWLDTRSAEIALRITRGLIRVGGYGITSLLRWLWYTNGAPNLAGRDPTSKILWLKEQRPDIWERTAKLLDVKDYLVQRCCGRFVTTPDVAHLTWLMQVRSGEKSWCPQLLSRLGIDAEMLPEICANSETVGQLHARAARDLGLPQGIAVLAGAGDVTASALGAGAYVTGELHLHLGTSAWLATHLQQLKVDVLNNIGTICSADNDRYLLVAAQQSGALSLECAIQMLNRNTAVEDVYTLVNAAVENSPVGAGGLIYTPWILGECVPKSVAGNRGEFFHLSVKHNNGDIYRAVMEGVALNIRWAQHAVIRHTGPCGQVRAVGGGANSRVWCRILADTLQMPVVQMEQPQLSGVFGSAMLAAVALGWYSSLAEATATARQYEVFDPDSAAGSYYQEAFERFMQLYRQQKKFS